MGIQPDQNFLIYPHYTLPDSTTFKKASVYATSLFNENSDQCRQNCSDSFFVINCQEDINDASEFSPNSSTPLVSTTCKQCDVELITHLEGNVREMTNVKGLFYGSSFLDSCDTPKNKISEDKHHINAYTGFRNACEYRVWKADE